jgi:2-keto-4-pentenoate hydratase/2-oxohepta-3-ene-1,7-dioic acid hydratase in catechol pathway
VKLLTFKRNGDLKLGCLVEGDVLDLNRAFEKHLGNSFAGIEMPFHLDVLSLLDLGKAGLEETKKALRQVETLMKEGEAKELYEEGALLKSGDLKIVAPIPRPRKNIMCLGLNYSEHVQEGRRARGEQPAPLPAAPIFFTKAPTTVIGPSDDIVYPRATTSLDYEVELAFVIGKKGKYIAQDKAYEHIVGYTVFNDVTARDLQRKHSQWFRGKSLDTFAPMGPYLVTFDEVADPMNLDLELKVNGETRQKSNTKEMIFSISTIVEVLSSGMTLEQGDIVATGTPSGVGSARGPEGLLKPGDLVEGWIEGLGKLKNRVVAEQ